MRSAILALCIGAFLAFALPAAAQAERISKAEYNTAVMKALEHASRRDRRIVTEETFYSHSALTGARKIVSDFIGPDAQRIDVYEDFNGKGAKQRSAVKIADQYFCKQEKKAWKKADKDCSKGSVSAIPDGEYEYFAASGQDSRKIYTRRASFTDDGLPERDSVRMKSIEIVIAVEGDEIVEYKETRRGGIEPATWSSIQITRYDYNVADLKITDPTIGN